MSTHDELRQMSAAYALGILDADEQDAFEAHLAVCPECLHDARRMLEGAEALGCVMSAPDLPAWQIVRAADVRRVDLAGQGVASRAVGHVWWSQSLGMVFAATGLPALPSEQVYRVWTVGGSGPVSAGVLEIDGDGRTALVKSWVGPVERPVVIAVTVESTAAAPFPTGPTYLEGTLT